MLSYTKIDVAEAQLTAAIRLFFEDGHPVPVHTLACSAREILTTLGDKLGMKTILHNFAVDKKITLRQAVSRAHEFVGFMKHADRHPTGLLEGFSDDDNDVVLWIASHDFSRVTGGMPVACQVLEAWFYATHVKRVSTGGLKWQRAVRRCIQLFPRIRSADRVEQKRMGLDRLRAAEADPTLSMAFRRTLDLASDDSG